MINIKDIRAEYVYGALIWGFGEPNSAIVQVIKFKQDTRQLAYRFADSPTLEMATVIDSADPANGEARFLTSYGMPPEENADAWWDSITQDLDSKTDREQIGGLWD